MVNYNNVLRPQNMRVALQFQFMMPREIFR